MISIILASGSLSGSMSALVSSDNCLRMPLGNRLALSEVVRAELLRSNQVYIVHSGPVPDFYEYLDFEVEWIDIEAPGETIGHSISLAFQTIFGSFEPDLAQTSQRATPGRIIFADTISSLDGLDVVAVGDAPSSEDWTFAPSNFSKEVIQGRATVESQRVISGAFSFSDLPKFSRLVFESVAVHDSLHLADPFFEAVRWYSTTLEGGLTAFQDAGWKDLGHREGYFQFRQTQLEGRDFNNFVSRPGGLFVKKISTHSDKLSDELSWFKSVPPGLSRFLPRVIDGEKDFYEVQYVKALTLAEKILYGQERYLDLSFAVNQLDYWFNATSLGSSRRMSFVEEAQLVSQFSEWFKSNLSSRLEKIEMNAPLFLLEKNRVRSALAKARQLISSISFQGEQAGIVHGDLIFSNILIDEQDHVFKLIDPRGGFGTASHLGLQIYDWAKIAQSIFGRYEELISGEYRIEEDDGRVSLSRDGDRIRNYTYISNWFQKSCPNPDFAKRMAGLLLISAIPFHFEDRRRATAMLLQGESLVRA